MPNINIDINAILQQIKSQVTTIASATVSNYKNQAIAAGEQIVTDMTADLTRWTQMLANGALSTDEFELLVKSYEVQVAVAGLQQAGLAEVRAYEFGMSVLNVIIDVAMKFAQTAAGSLLQPK